LEKKQHGAWRVAGGKSEGLELTCYPEHHLYLQASGHNLAKLAQRLEPCFKGDGAHYWYVM
jgi:hypothetical protein